MRIRLHIAYDGTAFHGWQRQLQPPEAEPPEGSVIRTAPDGRLELRTVQGVLEMAVKDLFRVDTPVQGASRTDAGVHAFAQTGAFDLPDDAPGPPIERLAQALNSRLPEDVRIEHAGPVSQEFEPISDCIAKGYTYTIAHGLTRPLWDRRTTYHVHHALDAGAMNEAAQRLVGTHDFAALTTINHGRESTVRTIHDCHVVASDTPEGERIRINVSGDGFLYNMVRIIAGTLVDAGRGRLTPDDLTAAIESQDRRSTGPTLGPQGLALMWGRYPDPIGTVGRPWNTP